MMIVDEIIDLAKTIEPASRHDPEFMLVRSSDGEWRAKVTCERGYYADATAKSGDECLCKLRDDLVAWNRKVNESIADRLKRWMVGDRGPRLVGTK